MDGTNKDLASELYQLRSKRRGDELKTHFSDLWTCLRAVHYRRSGQAPVPFTREELTKFQAGHDFEYGVARVLRDAGHTVEHGPDFEVSGFGLESGHPDILVDNATIIETKTTDARKPKESVQPHHAIQVAASALAIQEERGLKDLQAVVLVKHASHIETAYSVDPAALEPLIRARAAEVIAKTGPDAPMPAAQPTAFLPYNECQYCRFSQCHNSPKYSAMNKQKAS